MITLDDAFLNRVWCLYLDKKIRDPYERQYIQRSYCRVARRSGLALRFEELLFNEGAVIQRINKKCYLQFSDSEDALLFKLKNL